MRRAARLALATAAVLLVPVAPAPAAATWRLEQPDPPKDARFKVPLGKPGALECLAPDRCLLSVEGNSTVPRGLLFYDGVSWKQLSTVCGDNGDTSRIAWAGPDEFWTISSPSLPRRGAGTSLCRFKGGQVVASYSTADQSADPFRPMNAAACASSTNCWFGGIATQDPSGQRTGAFHLRWTGDDLRTVYAPQGRGVSDLTWARGAFWETVVVGASREDRHTPVRNAREEQVPQPIHRIDGGSFTEEPYAATPRSEVPVGGTELLATDGVGEELWFVGGGAASGPAAPADGNVRRPPVAVRKQDPFYLEVPFADDQFGPTDRFVDVAVVPGQQRAWVAVQRYEDRGSTTAAGRVALLDPAGNVLKQRLPASGAGRGSIAIVEMVGPDEGWAVTTAGWLFHLTDGRRRERNTDPAFASLIDFRPNEAVAQSVSDAPPADDSQLFAPPPVELVTQTQSTAATPRRLAALLTRVTKPKVSRKLVLRLSFTMRRTGRVRLQARRRGRVVAQTPLRRLRPGRHTLRLKLTRKRYPDALRFVTREEGATDDGGGAPAAPNDDTVVTTG